MWFQIIRRLSTSPLTRVRHPKLRRSPHYATLTDKDVNFFERLLPDGRAITNPDDCLPYNIDWIKTCQGQSQLVLRPKTTDEVQAILRYCHEHQLAVCPQSGNTGLAGGSVPVFDEIILSLSLLNSIGDFDENSGVLITDAGCILQTLDNHVRQFGHTMPIDLGAKGSCLIGGNVATNAGGIRVVRFGSLRSAVLGLEIILADGSRLDCLTSLRKDNTGVDLKQPFIGSEGILGIITRVALACPSAMPGLGLGFFACSSFENILSTMRLARKICGETLSAIEFLDESTYNLSLKNLQRTNKPVESNHFYILVETMSSTDEQAKSTIEKLATTALEKEFITDGTLAQDLTQYQDLWAIRERVPEALVADGYVFKYDFSLPPSRMYKLVEETQKRMKPFSNVRNVTGFGHLGDQNLHLNITVKGGYSDEIKHVLEPWLYEWVANERGSISAEHGLGLHKSKYLQLNKGKQSLELMKQMKNMFDPKGILNPYKVLPYQID
jgi:D-2-hydroxyglutarate dehydrogenase